MNDFVIEEGTKEEWQVVDDGIVEYNFSKVPFTANFPRVPYKIAGEMGWRRSIKANGLEIRDLYLRK